MTDTGYGTSMHYPYCVDVNCTGCLPPLASVETFLEGTYVNPPADEREGYALGVTEHQLNDPSKRLADWREGRR